MPRRTPPAPETAGRSGLLRRLAAAVYDGLLVLAVLVLATVPWLVYTGGEAVPAGNVLYTAYLLLVGLVFFGWFWTHGGQTLGMRAWRLRVAGLDGRPVTWRRATLRYLAALLSWLALGLGFLWQWLDPGRLTWHDRMSGTALELEPRRR